AALLADVSPNPSGIRWFATVDLDDQTYQLKARHYTARDPLIASKAKTLVMIPLSGTTRRPAVGLVPISVGIPRRNFAN
ncbi:hypothetical protein ABQE62_31370, partial [Mycolicibacterium fortuitum]